MKTILLIVALIALLTPSAFAGSPQRGSVTVEMGAGMAVVDGYMQTPLGGEPGTASKNRPTYDELGIDKGMMYDAAITWAKDDLMVYANGSMLTLEGDGTLEKNLMMRQQFLAGDDIKSKASYNRYAVGAGYRVATLAFGIDVVPRLEVQAMDFSVELKNETGTAIERSYMKFSPRVGLDLCSWLNTNLLLYGKANASIPISNMPTSYDVAVGVRQYFPNGFFLGLETKFGYLDYEDNQELPNHLRLWEQPSLMLRIGINR